MNIDTELPMILIMILESWCCLWDKTIDSKKDREKGQGQGQEGGLLFIKKRF